MNKLTYAKIKIRVLSYRSKLTLTVMAVLCILSIWKYIKATLWFYLLAIRPILNHAHVDNCVTHHNAHDRKDALFTTNPDSLCGYSGKWKPLYLGHKSLR